MTLVRPVFLRLLAWSCVAGAVIVGFYHLAVEWRILALKEPMNIWESYYVELSRHWAFLYQKGHFVEGLGLYGPGYPASVRPFLALGLEPYFAHRLAALVAILAACLLLAAYLRSKGVRGWIVGAVVAIVYALNAGSYSISARPDFLFVLEAFGLLILGERMASGGKPTATQAVLLGLLGFAAYLTKPYALLAWATAAGYLAFGCGAWTAASLSAAILLAGVGLYAGTHFYFWLDTFDFIKSQTAYEASALATQTRDFAGLACGLLAAALFAKRWESPSKGRPDYWVVATWIGGLPLLYLGLQAGAYLTYYLHLLLPPLAILAALRTEEAVRNGNRWWVPAFLCANLAVLALFAPALPRDDPGWEALASDLARQKGPVAASWILAPFTASRPDLALTSDGMTPVTLAVTGELRGSGPALTAAREEVAAFKAQLFHMLTGPNHPAAIYLEGITMSMAPNQYVFVKKAQPELLMVPFDRSGTANSVFVARENLGELRKSLLGLYQPEAYFDVRPYYVQTNGRREFAGTWYTSVLKLVLKP